MLNKSNFIITVTCLKIGNQLYWDPIFMNHIASSVECIITFLVSLFEATNIFGVCVCGGLLVDLVLFPPFTHW